MRWILVFLFLYLIPLITLFKNYSNFKRSCMYSSVYVVLVSTIVITNIYMSGLNKIKEAMYYHNYAVENRYYDKYASNFDKDFDSENKTNISKHEDVSKIVDEEDKHKVEDKKNSEDLTDEESNGLKGKQPLKPIEDIESNQKADKEIIFEFKKKIYDIETVALIPMRDCMPYTTNISENIKNLTNIKEDLEYAGQKCEEVMDIYDKMEIPLLSNNEYTKVLDNARSDVKKAYELRKKAMESSIKLINTKNPKYIGKITEYLNLSDNHITSFKERLSDLDKKIDENKTIYN
ncbi:hypothetical protein [Romboutsia sp.]|uniref:hypothetical protein n=1 Tax=Romboutsia sp. TaxID=1965302 RepID=UPI002CA365F3|nr:hypothetical protein [Romboutsia sp.]HSQ89539.1 hypothetical protein [Romboutsia sp.]